MVFGMVDTNRYGRLAGETGGDMCGVTMRRTYQAGQGVAAMAVEVKAPLLKYLPGVPGIFAVVFGLPGLVAPVLPLPNAFVWRGILHKQRRSFLFSGVFFLLLRGFSIWVCRICLSGAGVLPGSIAFFFLLSLLLL